MMPELSSSFHVRADEHNPKHGSNLVTLEENYSINCWFDNVYISIYSNLQSLKE